jgi:hypothetical protein
MKCHICGEQAVKQCDACSKFLCKRHNADECLEREPQIHANPPPVEDLAKPSHLQSPRIPSLVAHSANCGFCNNLALGVCSECEEFYCLQHGGGAPTGWIGQQGPTALCATCRANRRRSQHLMNRLIDVVLALLCLAIITGLVVAANLRVY